ncbi:hypothetical protein BH11MYX1_BH11MYX1_49270 [soil metagenome]
MISRHVTLALLLALAPLAHASEVKKDREAASKSVEHPAPPVAGVKPVPLSNLYNEHTLEWLAVDPAALPVNADHFLRDHYTNEAMQMARQLVPIVVAAAQHFKIDTVNIVSAFRHPKFNLVLRKKGHQVARDSQHSHGNAIDFFLATIPTQVLHAWAKAQKRGGVGIYLQSGFVHMDIGPVRYWSGD